MTVRVAVVRADWADASVALPDYATSGAAGADVRVNFPPERREQGQTLAPMSRVILPTGLRIAIPEGYELQLRPRSGLAFKQGLTLINTPGTIDSDYRGDVGVLMINLGTEAVTIAHGDRIAQAVIAPVLYATFTQVDELDDSARGAGGFGSTGVR